MMDVHEADGVVPSDTEEENDDSSSSSPSSSASSTMVLFDKPQPLVLELHELKKTDHPSTDRQITVPLEQVKGKKQLLSAINDKARKLKKKRKSSNASKLPADSEHQSKEASDLTASTPAGADSTKEEFFDAQDTVLPPTDIESSPDSSTTPLVTSDVAPIADSMDQEVDPPLPRFTSSIVSSPWAKAADDLAPGTKPVPDSKLVPDAKLDADATVIAESKVASNNKLVIDTTTVVEVKLDPEAKLTPDATIISNDKFIPDNKPTPNASLLDDAKMTVASEVTTPAGLPKELSQPNVRVISQPQSVTSHRSANAITKPSP